MKTDVARKVLSYLRTHRRRLVLVSGVVMVLGVGGLMVYHRPYSFSFSGNNCFGDVTWLPRLYKSNPGAAYRVYLEGHKSLAGYPILSTKTCLSPNIAPNSNSGRKTGLSIVGIPVAGKQFEVVTPRLPVLKAETHKGKISIRADLVIKLDQADGVFSYEVSGNSKKSSCKPRKQQLLCNVEDLDLAQDKAYPIRVTRQFNDQSVGTVLQQTFKTTDPVVITQTSITNGAIVYDLPGELIIDASKDLESTDIKLQQMIDNKPIDVASSISVKGKKVTVAFAKALARRAAFRLTVNDLMATDKSVILEPQVYAFTTSGGPKVVAASIDSRSVEPGRAIVLTFDQGLKTDQDLTGKVAVTTAGAPAVVQVSISGNKLVLQPKVAWGLCVPFSIKLSADFVSNYGLSGDSTWQINSRTICYSISAIGYSVQGRPIYAWRFGSGASKILFVGATHGNERSTKYLMDEWVKELETNPTRLPAGKTIIVVPVINPDGFAADRRQNAQNVDLNRNFPTNDWKSNVTMPGGGTTPVVNGGGAAPLSEPESQALSNFVLNERPGLILTYHSVASVVSGNDSGNSASLALAYAQASGYRYLPKSDTNTVFQYDTTGAFEDWLYDKVGIAAILVELGSSSRSEIAKNRDAMWMMLAH